MLNYEKSSCVGIDQSTGSSYYLRFITNFSDNLYEQSEFFSISGMYEGRATKNNFNDSWLNNRS